MKSLSSSPSESILSSEGTIARTVRGAVHGLLGGAILCGLGAGVLDFNPLPAAEIGAGVGAIVGGFNGATSRS